MRFWLWWTGSPSGVTPPSGPSILGVHVVHESGETPGVTDVSSSSPNARRRSSGSPTLRNVEGE